MRGNVYSRSLGHVCIIASTPRGAGSVKENHNGQCVVSWDANSSTSVHLAHHMWVEPLLPQYWPLPRQGVYLHIKVAWDIAALNKHSLPWTTGESAVLVCKASAIADLLGDLYRKPPMCCLSGQAHDDPLGLGGNVSA